MQGLLDKSNKVSMFVKWALKIDRLGEGSSSLNKYLSEKAYWY